jgi:hypothetical protein
VPFTVRKPIDSPSMAPARSSESSSRARHFGDQPPARIKAAVVLAQFEPDADRLRRVVLEQHRNAVHAARVSAGSSLRTTIRRRGIGGSKVLPSGCGAPSSQP